MSHRKRIRKFPCRYVAGRGVVALAAEGRAVDALEGNAWIQPGSIRKIRKNAGQTKCADVIVRVPQYPLALNIGSSRPKRKLFTRLVVRGIVCEIIQLSDFPLKFRFRMEARRNAVDVLFSYGRGGEAEEHGSKATQLLIKFVGLLDSRCCGNEPRVKR